MGKFQASIGFAMIPHATTANPNLTDEGYRLLGALEAFACNGPTCGPTNAALARQCGWLLKKSGKPAVSKVKRIFEQLEKLGYVRRELSQTGPLVARDAIVMLRPDPLPEVVRDRIEAAQNQAAPRLNLGGTRPENGLSPGLNLGGTPRLNLGGVLNKREKQSKTTTTTAAAAGERLAFARGEGEQTPEAEPVAESAAIAGVEVNPVEATADTSAELDRAIAPDVEAAIAEARRVMPDTAPAVLSNLVAEMIAGGNPADWVRHAFEDLGMIRNVANPRGMLLKILNDYRRDGGPLGKPRYESPLRRKARQAEEEAMRMHEELQKARADSTASTAPSATGPENTRSPGQKMDDERRRAAELRYAKKPRNGDGPPPPPVFQRQADTRTEAEKAEVLAMFQAARDKKSRPRATTEGAMLPKPRRDSLDLILIEDEPTPSARPTRPSNSPAGPVYLSPEQLEEAKVKQAEMIARLKAHADQKRQLTS